MAVVTAVVFLGIVLLAPWLVQAFLSNTNPELNLTSVHALRRYSLCYLILGVNILIGGFLTAVGAPPSCHLHFRRARPGAPSGGADGLGFHCGRQQHLVCAADLGIVLPVLSQKFLRNFLQAP